MAHALTTDQVSHIVNNTMVVMLARPDLMPDWRANLQDLLRQARDQSLEDEMLFVAAVLTLLNSPDDTLPTGTVYDYAWESLLVSLATGVAQPLDQEDSESLDRLLQSVAEAVVAVLTQAPTHKDAVRDEVRDMRASAIEASVPDLKVWLDDLLALLDGVPPSTLGQQHQGPYAAYWDAIMRSLGNNNANGPASAHN